MGMLRCEREKERNAFTAEKDASRQIERKEKQKKYTHNESNITAGCAHETYTNRKERMIESEVINVR